MSDLENTGLVDTICKNAEVQVGTVSANLLGALRYLCFETLIKILNNNNPRFLANQIVERSDLQSKGKGKAKLPQAPTALILMYSIHLHFAANVNFSR